MADINLWSIDAENNNMTPPHGWPEGMNYSAVNNAARENMAAIKRWFDDISGKLDATGQANLYAVTLNAGYSSYFRGMAFRCKIPATNTGASTINVNAIGPRNIVRADGSALEAGMLRQGHAYSFYFDGTNFRVDATTLVPDGALSDNVPLKDAPNTFTARATFTSTTSGSAGSSIVLQSASPGITLVEEDAGEDEKAWNIARTSNGRLVFFTATDALIGTIPSGGIFMAVERSGTAITEVELNAALLDFNGNADISGTLTVGGTITGNGSGLTSLNASNLSSGTVPNARLSDKVPLKDAGNNVFTGQRQTFQNARPSLFFVETDASADAGRWELAASSDQFVLNIFNDENQFAATPFRLQRSGTAVTLARFDVAELEVNADLLDVNGNADISGTLAVGGTITGNGSGLTSLNASNLSSGTVPDARLSDNVPLKDAPNEFSAPATFSTTSPRVEFFETDVGADEGRWRIFAADGRFGIQARDDDSTVGSTFMAVSRSGTTVTEVELNATLLDFNGNADISGTLAVGGAATFSNDVTVGGTISGTISGNGSGLTSLNASNLSSGTVPDARLPSEMSAKEFATTLGSIRIGGGAGDYRTYNFATRNSNAVWYFDRAIVEYLEFRRHENGEGFSSPFRFDFMDDSLSVAGGVDIGGTLAVGGAATFSNNVTVGGTLAVDGAARAGTAATSTSSTLAAGQIHHRSSNTTVPNLGAGRWVAVQNTGTSSITLSQGSGVTLELGGTTMTGNRTLLPKGFAFIYFRANGVGVVHGSGVT